MTKTSSASPLRLDMSGVAPAARAILDIFARVLSGATLVIVAALVAVTAATIGTLLAIAALAMRFAKPKQSAFSARGAKTSEDSMTLDARRTPRGWTVE